MAEVSRRARSRHGISPSHTEHGARIRLAVSFLRETLREFAKPWLGLRPEAEDTLTFCCRAVSGEWTGTSEDPWLFTLYSFWEEELCQWL